MGCATATRGRISAVLVACSAWCLTDCRDPTQITLEVSTDAACPDVGNTTITVGRLGEVEDKPATTSTDRCRDDGRVGTLVVVPSGDKDEEVTIRLVTGIKKTAEQCVLDGYKGGCIVARRAVRFVPHTPLLVPVEMSIDCLDIPCETTETCFKGSCIPANTSCNDTGTCVPPNPDGGAVDAGIDITPDQSEDVLDAGIDLTPNPT